MSEHYVGACGKHVTTMCYPEMIDDLCVGCAFNGWAEMQDDMEQERDEELRYLEE